jgi:hypothetical protein
MIRAAKVFGLAHGKGRGPVNEWRSGLIRLLTSNVLAAAIGVAAIGSALASNFGSNTGGVSPAHPCDATAQSQCIADNWTHTTYIGYLASNALMRGATIYAVGHYDGNRDVSSILTTASYRDVLVVQASHGDSGYWAFTACDEVAVYGGTDPNRWCRPQWIVYNMTHPFSWHATLAGRETVACHEMGHTLGLRHVADAVVSCMDSGQTTERTTNAHDNDELNAKYYPY